MLVNRRRAHNRCSLAISVAAMLVLLALTGCGGEQQSGPVQANSVPVSLRLTFPQQSAALEPAATRASRFWAALEAWLPTATTAWARESVTNLSTLRVTVTGEGLQIPVTAEKQVTNPAVGDVIAFELAVPQGVNRVFTVDGFKNQLIIFTGRSVPITLTVGQAASVDITLADNTGTISGSISTGVNTGATATMTVQGITLLAPITSTGTFTLDGVPRGDYTVVLSAPGFISKNVPVVVQAGSTVSVGAVVLDQAPPADGIIVGTVINANTREPISDATVSVSGINLPTTTNGTGTFTVKGVPAGQRTLTVNKSGFVSSTTTTVQVTQGSTSNAGTISLAPVSSEGGGSGQLSVANAPSDVGGTFLVNPKSTYAVTYQIGIPPISGTGITWQEGETASLSHLEGMTIGYALSTGNLDSSYVVFTSISYNPFTYKAWWCVDYISACNITLNVTTRTVSFNNSVLTDLLSNASAITLNGTLTYPDPIIILQP